MEKMATLALFQVFQTQMLQNGFEKRWHIYIMEFSTSVQINDLQYKELYYMQQCRWIIKMHVVQKEISRTKYTLCAYIYMTFKIWQNDTHHLRI